MSSPQSVNTMGTPTSWPLSSTNNLPRFTREDSLARLYAPAIAFERLSVTLERIPQLQEDDEKGSTPTRPRSLIFPLKQVTSARPSENVKRGPNPIARDYGLNHNASVRRKPVPQVLESPAPTKGVTRDPSFPNIKSSDATRLLQAGNAAQAKRKKRRVSTAFSEMLIGLGEKKEGDSVGEDGEEVDGVEVKPRRIKRLKTRLSGWFGVSKKED